MSYLKSFFIVGVLGTIGMFSIWVLLFIAIMVLSLMFPKGLFFVDLKSLSWTFYEYPALFILNILLACGAMFLIGSYGASFSKDNFRYLHGFLASIIPILGFIYFILLHPEIGSAGNIAIVLAFIVSALLGARLLKLNLSI